jgi:hypothetical protein
MSSHYLEDQIAEGLNSGPKNEYKESKDNNLDQEFKDDKLDEEKNPDLSRDPDLGHLEAERILEEQRLEVLRAKKDEEEIEEAREEDRQELKKTYGRL